MLARFFAANRIPLAVNQANLTIGKMEMDFEYHNQINNEMQSIMDSINQLLSLYNFNQTCKYWLDDECKFGAQCVFKHEFIKINKPCRYGKTCNNQDKCLFLHPGETVNNFRNSPRHQHMHRNQNNGSNNHSNSNQHTGSHWQVKQQSQQLSNNSETKETMDDATATSNSTNEDIIMTATTITSDNTNVPLSYPQQRQIDAYAKRHNIPTKQYHQPTLQPPNKSQPQTKPIATVSDKKNEKDEKNNNSASGKTASLTTAVVNSILVPSSHSNKQGKKHTGKNKNGTNQNGTNKNGKNKQSKGKKSNNNTSQPPNKSQPQIKPTAITLEKNNKNKDNKNDITTTNENKSTASLSDRPDYNKPKWLRTTKNKFIMSLVIIAAGEEYTNFEAKTNYRLDYYSDQYRTYERIISKDGFYPDASDCICKVSKVDLVGRVQEDIIVAVQEALCELLPRLKSTYMKEIIKYEDSERIQNGIWNEIVTHYISQQFLEIIETAINKMWEKDGNPAINAGYECTYEYIYRSTSEYNVHPMIIFLANTHKVYPLIDI